MIKKIRMQNCKTYDDSTIEFAPGVTAITGATGHGKSNIVAGLKWVCENRPLKNKCIRRGQSRGVATVTVENGGQEIEIERTKDVKKGGENTYVVTTGGKSSDPYEAFGNDPPQDITDLFNLGELNRQKQISPHFLVFDSPGKIAQYIRSVTKLTEIDQVIKLITSKTRAATSILKADKLTLERKTVQLGVLQDIPLQKMSDLIADVENLQTENVGIKVDTATLSSILKNIGLLDEYALTLPDNVDTIILGVEHVVSENCVTILSRDALKSILDQIAEIDDAAVYVSDWADALISEIEQAVTDRIQVDDAHYRLKSVLDAIADIDATVVHVEDRAETLISKAEQCIEVNNTTNRNIDTLLGVIDQVTSVDEDLDSLAVEIAKEESEYQLLLEQLEECPDCGSTLTEACKTRLLETKR